MELWDHGISFEQLAGESGLGLVRRYVCFERKFTTRKMEQQVQVYKQSIYQVNE